MKQGNILLVNPISAEPPPMYFGPPYGLALIAAVLEKNGNKPICMDFEKCTYEDMESSILESLEKKDVKYIGISCQSSNRNYVYRIVEKIKEKRQDVYVILGGPFSSQKYQLLLKNFPIDFIVRGDGEITFNELVEKLERGGDIKDVDGLAYFKEDKLILTQEREKVTNLDMLPFPAFHLFNVKENLDESKSTLQREIEQRKIEAISGKRCTRFPNALMVLSSIGCIFSCSFCPMSGLKKGKYKEHSPEVFVDLVEKLHYMYNQKYFVFGDNTFTLNIQKAKDICNEIIKRDLDILWVCMTRIDYLDRDLLFLMRKAGCVEISFGVESCSPKVQKTIGKNINLDKLKSVFEWCSEAGIKTILMLMVGNPGETKETIKETLKNCRELEPDDVQVKRIKVYPGTRIHEQFEAKGFITDEYYLKSETSPPVFTIENDEETINYFKSMFNLRNIDLELGGRCNNNCKYCKSFDHNKKRTTSQVKDALLQVADRAYEVTLTNRDPCIRDDISEILDYAYSLGISKINMETNARMFSNSRFFENMDFLKVKKIIVPIFSTNKEIFEGITKTPGSFRQTIKGLKNLLRKDQDIKIIVKIPIVNENRNDLKLICEKLARLGIKNFRFVYEPIEDMDFPDPAYFKKELKKSLSFLSSKGLFFTVYGVPYCFIPEFEDYIEDLQRPFDEIYDIGGKLINIGKEKRKKRVKNQGCVECRFNSICEGQWNLNNYFYSSKSEKTETDIIDKKTTHSLGVVNATTVCNLNCIFCNEASLRETPRHFSKEVVRKRIMQLKERGVTSINFMGGEITTRPDFFEILDFVKENGLKVGIATNMINFSDYEFAKKTFERIDFMELSFHTINKEDFTGLYGKEMFDTYISGAENIFNLNNYYKKMLVFNILINSFNFDKLKDISSYIIEKVSKKYCIFHFRMVENEGAAKYNPYCFVSLRKALPYLLEALELVKKRDYSVKVDNIPVCLLRGYEEYSRTILESMIKLNQYYLNKKDISEDIDFEKNHNKHLYGKANYRACKDCFFKSFCRGLEKGTVIDHDKIIKQLGPAKFDLKSVLEKAKKNNVLAYEI